MRPAMLDLVTLGEAMVALTPLPPGPLRFASLFVKSAAGAEMNVAITVTRMGLRAGFIGRVGRDEFGRYLVATIRGEGVDTSRVVVDPEAPTGLFFKEIRHPADVRVHYYRKGSAGSRLNPGDVDPEYVGSARALYVSGITSALSDTCHAAVKKAVAAARARGCRVYFDPNYRARLWNPERARQAWVELLPQCDVVMPSLEEARILAGDGPPADVAGRLLGAGPRLVLLKEGDRGAWVVDGSSVELVPPPRRGRTVDPVGAGDAFAGGFIAGELRGLGPVESARLGALLASYAVEAMGDTEGIPTYEELVQSEQVSSDVTR